ncbi:MAG TPA: hypothetical protein VIT45_08665 [Allosphingosinicella sp.]
MKPLHRALLAILAAALLAGASPRIAFTPAQPDFAAGAAEYARIWESDGPRIVAALESASGLRFPDGRAIEANVSGARPMMSYDGRSMRLRAGYSPDYKKATLVHELGHGLAFLLPRGDLDDHRLLYLFLYDAWTDLYGRDFADRMAAIERRIPGGYDYDAAWAWALSQTREERQERLRALRDRL